MKRFIVNLVVLLSIAPAGIAAETIDKTILERTENEVLPFLKANKVQNVGVLKFSVAEGRGEPGDTGELNRTIADRLEMALILRTDIRNPVGIVRNATGVAAAIRGADHRTSEGREKLFAAKYPLAWGTESVSVDALLSGVVRIEADNTLNVNVVAYLPGQPKAVQVVRFQASADVATLIESGSSFTTRGLFDGGRPEVEDSKLKEKERTVRDDATRVALKTRQDPTLHPANPTSEPVVGVKILYDGVEQKVEFREGEAWVAEPGRGQDVRFAIARADKSIAGPLAVVLKINGENTIDRQRARDPECGKWLLEAGGVVVVKGFLLPEGDRSEPFKVLSAEASKASEFRYGHEVGTISWSAFRSYDAEKAVGPKPDYDALDEIALSRGLFPTESHGSLRGLRQHGFYKSGGNATRGLIVEDKGNSVATPTKTVKFQADPVPVLHATVRYYSAKK